jgi:two-component system, OmpR family, sensor kinase
MDAARRSGGLGGVGRRLAIVRGIVEAHGGQVVVVGTPGEGIQFSSTLPAAG